MLRLLPLALSPPTTAARPPLLPRLEWGACALLVACAAARCGGGSEAGGDACAEGVVRRVVAGLLLLSVVSRS